MAVVVCLFALLCPTSSPLPTFKKKIGMFFFCVTCLLLSFILSVQPYTRTYPSLHFSPLLLFLQKHYEVSHAASFFQGELFFSGGSM